MPSLTAKVIHGKTYYYARECKRVGGKPKIVRTIYLGSLDNILNAVQQAKQPVQHQSVDIAAFGDVVALWDLAEQIGLVDIINRHVPTYLDTNNPTELAERGHNKQKRNDLRQVSLGMMVSTDFHVPLFHKVYAGNVTDSVIFKTVSEELRARYVELARDCEHITLVFDKGNNSEEAFETLDNSDFHFVGSLVGSHHRDLWDVPLEKYRQLEGERLQSVRAYRRRGSGGGGTVG